MSSGIRIRLPLRHPAFSLDLDLDLPGRGVSALFGASGSGKTSALRAIAGLDRVAGGFLEIDGEVWQDEARGHFVPTHRRRLGYVFQDASLFPHLCVRGNLEFGYRRAGRPRAVDFDGTVEMLGIAGLLDRRPDRLSGGERQRVAIARALLSAPRLLLMDEPLSALQAELRRDLLPHLERLHEHLEIPLIYVSHAVEEVARLADHLVLLGDGRVQASGPLPELLARLDLAGAFADEAGVVIQARVAAHDEQGHLTQLEFPGGALWVTRRPEPPGQRLRCRVLARDVSLSLQRPVETSILNLIPAHIVEAADTQNRAHLMLRLDADGTPLLARITRRSWQTLRLAPGSAVWAQVKAAALLG